MECEAAPRVSGGNTSGSPHKEYAFGLQEGEVQRMDFCVDDLCCDDL